MSRRKRKLTAAEKAEKKRRREQYMTIFIRGKQRRIRRPPTIDGMDVDEFIRLNADPIFLHQNEMWELMDCGDQNGVGSEKQSVSEKQRPGQVHRYEDDDIPF